MITAPPKLENYAPGQRRHRREPNAAVEYNPTDLLNFIIKNFGPLNAMMQRAGMSEMDIYNRTRDIFHYFKLPYDAPLPVD